MRSGVRSGEKGRKSASRQKAGGQRAGGSPWRERWAGGSTYLAGLLLVLATIAAYSNTFHGPFVFDDEPDIVENLSIHRLWPLWQAFLVESATGTCLRNRPVVNLSLAVNYATGGPDTFHYHLTNLAVHVLAGLTLFGIARRTLRLPRLAERYGKVATPLAFTLAAIWMLHPLQTGAVTYLIQRYESMMGLFYLLSLYCAIRSDGSPRAGWWAAGSVAACLLAMGSKEVAVSAPLMILLYDRAFLAGSFGECWRRRRGLYVGLAGTWVAFGLLFLFSGSRSQWAGFGLPVSAVEYARSQFGVILHYLRLSFWPYPQVFDYGWPVARTAAEIVPGLLVVGGLLAATVYALIRWPMWGVLGAWFFLILAPTSSIMPIADLAFEHRMYLSLAAVVAAAVIAAYELLERLLGRLPARTRAIEWCLVLPALAVPIALAGLTYLRNEVYRSPLSLWQDTVDKAPHHDRAHGNLGKYLYHEGRFDEAIACCRKALEIKPQSAGVHTSLGCSLVRQGKIDEAIAHFRKALEIEPRQANAHYNLAITLWLVGRSDEAFAHCRAALKIQPCYAEAHNKLGSALGQQGKTEEAIFHFQKALEMKPWYAEAHCNLATSLWVQGRLEEAVAHCREALAIQPRYAEAHNSLGTILFRQGKIAEAIAHFQRALEIKPEYAEARHNLAKALGLQGKAQEAIIQ